MQNLIGTIKTIKHFFIYLGDITLVIFNGFPRFSFRVIHAFESKKNRPTQ